MKRYFEIFKKLLEERIKSGIYTTEDSVRYLFFSTLILDNEFKPNMFVMEYPHTSLKAAKIDTCIFAENNNWVIEFKYDRKIPSKQNSPRTIKAGKLFNDINRLSKFCLNDKDRYLFIYLTDDEMNSYLNNRQNNLCDFYNLQIDNELLISSEYFESFSDTLKKQIMEDLNCKIKKLYSEDIFKNHFLRIYEVFKNK